MRTPMLYPWVMAGGGGFAGVLFDLYVFRTTGDPANDRQLGVEEVPTVPFATPEGDLWRGFYEADIDPWCRPDGEVVV